MNRAQTLKIIKFWIIAFSLIMWNVLRGRQWNMVYVDFDFGGQKRKQYIAKRSCGSYDIYWQDLGNESSPNS